jgi:alcohol dehydrogenase class IV
LPSKRPETWPLEKLARLPPEGTLMISTASVSDRATNLTFQAVENVESLPDGLDTLIVIGGGRLIDEAKYWRAQNSPKTKLIAIPSVWGSGAEVSPIVVLNRGGAKEIHVGDRFVPDVRCLWPELADSLPEPLARRACGDTWSHALEGILSPLASDEVRRQLAELVRELQELPVGNEPAWYELSARACASQAEAGVGLVHGIAHTLEGPLSHEFPDQGWGHARLCSVYLWPVMAYNDAHSDKWRNLAAEFNLDSARIFGILRSLHEADAYEQALPLLTELWGQIVRDPCTRTNSTLVRPAALSYFTERRFR